MQNRTIADLVGFTKSIPVGVHLIGGLTLIVWTFKACVLDMIAEPFVGMDGLGRVMEGVFSAIFAGYVFYILFALYPEYKSKSVVAHFIGTMVRRIVGDCVAIMNEISDKSGKRIELRSSTKREIEDAFSAAPGNANPNMVIVNGQQIIPATWHQYFINQQLRTKQCVSNLLDRSRFLDADLIEIITSISESSFFQMTISISNVIHLSAPYTDLGPFGTVFDDYKNNCARLAKWHDKHFSEEPVLFPV